jgi:hypothetical protein
MARDTEVGPVTRRGWCPTKRAEGPHTRVGMARFVGRPPWQDLSVVTRCSFLNNPV